MKTRKDYIDGFLAGKFAIKDNCGVMEMTNFINECQPHIHRYLLDHETYSYYYFDSDEKLQRVKNNPNYFMNVIDLCQIPRSDNDDKLLHDKLLLNDFNSHLKAFNEGLLGIRITKNMSGRQSLNSVILNCETSEEDKESTLELLYNCENEIMYLRKQSGLVFSIGRLTGTVVRKDFELPLPYVNSNSILDTLEEHNLSLFKEGKLGIIVSCTDKGKQNACAFLNRVGCKSKSFYKTLSMPSYKNWIIYNTKKGLYICSDRKKYTVVRNDYDLIGDKPEEIKEIEKISEKIKNDLEECSKLPFPISFVACAVNVASSVLLLKEYAEKKRQRELAEARTKIFKETLGSRGFLGMIPLDIVKILNEESEKYFNSRDLEVFNETTGEWDNLYGNPRLKYRFKKK